MSEPQIFLDESMEITPLDGFIVVETEIEFLRNDGAERLWARGNQLCDYVNAVYQARKVKVTKVTTPRTRLFPLLGETAKKIDASLLDRLLETLESENPRTLAELLHYLTREEFWIQPTSIEHGANFLMINLSEDLLDLAEAQRQIWLNTIQDQKLNQIYARNFNEREDFLQQWLLDETTRQNLGEFPLQISDQNAALFRDEIGRKLRSTNGEAVTRFPKKTPNKKIYAKAALDYFSHNTIQLTSDYIARISSLLSSAERVYLEKLLPPVPVTPLDISADFQTALNWATDLYLPFRSYQNETGKCDEADALASSFADWLLENYPRLTNLDRETSPINLKTFYTVKNLLEREFWVLWVVVDGLSYQNHQKLLKLLGEKSANLRVAKNSPVFAVLPTITEKAKYGLTSGKFPSENSGRDWSPKNNFLAEFANGVYAGSAGTAKISDGLQRETPTVCYWNYLNIDACYHNQTDLTFIQHEVDAQLQGLAGKINQLVDSARDKNRVAVVICSDHGQMTSSCRKLEIELSEKYAHGRTALDNDRQVFAYSNSAFVKTNDGETVYLNPTSFRLSEPTTIALGSTYFVDLKANAANGAVGVHGGLFPEEAIIGMAVLMRQPSHKKLTVTANGNGETGKSGTLLLTIDNPNATTVNPLSITINNLEIGNQTELLFGKVAAQKTVNFEISIEKFPAPTDGDEFLINGTLRYEFDDATQEDCVVTGKLICKSLYATKNPSLLDRFKK